MKSNTSFSGSLVIQPGNEAVFSSAPGPRRDSFSDFRFFKIDITFSCVCTVIDHEIRHNIVKTVYDQNLLYVGSK